MKLSYVISVLFFYVTLTTAASLPKNATLAVLPPLGPDGKITELSDYLADVIGGGLTAEGGVLVGTPEVIRAMLKLQLNPNLVPDRTKMIRLSRSLKTSHFVVGSYQDLGSDYLFEYQIIKISNGAVIKNDELMLRKDNGTEKMAFQTSGYFLRSKSDVKEQWEAPQVVTTNAELAEGVEADCYAGSIVLCRVTLERKNNFNLKYMKQDPELFCETNSGQVLRIQNQRVNSPVPSTVKKGVFRVEAELFFAPTDPKNSMGSRLSRCKIPFMQGNQKDFVSLDNERFRQD